MKIIHIDPTVVVVDDAEEMTGIDLVRFAITHDWDSGYHVIINIIGRLVDKLPEDDRLAVCGLEHRMARAS